MQIGERTFQFVSYIELEVDSRGRFSEYSPALRYHNVNNLPLHKYGSGPFCHFRLSSLVDGIGVYCIVDENKQPLYIGKCTGASSTLLKRFNQGYGSIQPRNCYKDGQSTNCRINRLVLEAIKQGKRLSVFFHQTTTGQQATDLEATLIRRVGKPTWNINEPW